MGIVTKKVYICEECKQEHDEWKPPGLPYGWIVIFLHYMEAHAAVTAPILLNAGETYREWRPPEGDAEICFCSRTCLIKFFEALYC